LLVSQAFASVLDNVTAIGGELRRRVKTYFHTWHEKLAASGWLAVEDAMKAMIGVVLLSGAFFSDPPKALGMLGPEAQVIGWKIRSGLDLQNLAPWLRRIAGR
jgi:hypothetical protein